MLPNWVIATLIRPHGLRLPPRDPHWEPPKTRKKSLLGKYYEKRDKDAVTVRDGNLENAEYEFYAGVDFQSAPSSHCRCCHHMVFGAEERKRHKDKDCHATLKAAYKLLCIDMACVMCDARTLRKKWGVPLCSNECIQKFKFYWGVTPAIDEAVGLVRRRGLTT